MAFIHSFIHSILNNFYNKKFKYISLKKTTTKKNNKFSILACQIFILNDIEEEKKKEKIQTYLYFYYFSQRGFIKKNKNRYRIFNNFLLYFI
jgi:hypothetical protein